MYQWISKVFINVCVFMSFENLMVSTPFQNNPIYFSRKSNDSLRKPSWKAIRNSSSFIWNILRCSLEIPSELQSSFTKHFMDSFWKCFMDSSRRSWRIFWKISVNLVHQFVKDVFRVFLKKKTFTALFQKFL